MAKVPEKFEKSKFSIPSAQTVKLFFLVGQAVQNCKKIMNRINFLAIHVNEQQFLLGIKPIIHSQKLYTWTVSGIFIKPPVFGGYLLYRLNKNLNLTQA